jgi:hypothetical protein
VQNGALDDTLKTQRRLCFGLRVFGNNRRVILGKACELMPQCFKLRTAGT